MGEGPVNSQASVGMMEVRPLTFCLSSAIFEKSTFAFIFRNYLIPFSRKENIMATILVQNNRPAGDRKWRRNRLNRLN
jgi:hypothetical protein